MDYGIITVSTDRFNMNCIKFGTGKKIFVMIPGLSLVRVTGSAMTISAAYSEFCDEYTVYCFDRVENIPEGYTVRQMAHDTAKAMIQLGISDAYIFGASQGGMIGQYIAIDYPHLVKKLIIGSSCSRFSEASRNIFSKWIELAKQRDVVALNHDFFINIYSETTLESYKKALPILEKNGTAEDCRNFEILASACDGFSTYNELDKIKCPVLVLGSEDDKVLTGRASEEIAEKLGCEIYMYKDFGHAVYDEAPDYKQRIAKFFAE